MSLLTNSIFWCFVVLILIVPVHNAPRSKGGKGHQPIKYDQKQTGDYNIQVHLKDFHIVALLGDDPWGSYGDYEYNYDYSDLTVKPTIPLTTERPENTSSDSNLDQEKPNVDHVNAHPYPIVSPPTTHQPLEKETTLQIQASTTEVSSEKLNITNNEESTTLKLEQQPGEYLGIPVILMPAKATKLESSIVAQNNDERKTETPVTNISIVPVGSVGTGQSDARIPLGEIKHYRKCSEGYTKDKQGRCRKIRRTPHLPFGISRFASSLASRFRQSTSEEGSIAERR